LAKSSTLRIQIKDSPLNEKPREDYGVFQTNSQGGEKRRLLPYEKKYKRGLTFALVTGIIFEDDKMLFSSFL
jgi:hypothetical protein